MTLSLATAIPALALAQLSIQTLIVAAAPAAPSTASFTTQKCAWPCPHETDTCIFNPSTQTTACQPIVNAQWIAAASPDSVTPSRHNAPALATVGNACQPHPPSSTSSSHAQVSSPMSLSLGICAPGLVCVADDDNPRRPPTCQEAAPMHHNQRREDGNTFHKTTHHTTAFNVVHVIVAIVGVAGAALVSITAFVMCRRRRRRRQQLAKEKRLTASTTRSSDTQETSMDRFNQFAQDYSHAHDGQPEPPPKSHQPQTDKEPLVSPSMQQIHLHRQLLEQHQQRPPPPYYP